MVGLLLVGMRLGREILNRKLQLITQIYLMMSRKAIAIRCGGISRSFVRLLKMRAASSKERV